MAEGTRGAQSITITEMMGTTPAKPLRPVSLALRGYLLTHHSLGKNAHIPEDAGRGSREKIGIVVGVSGGADSVALAAAAIDLGNRWGIPVLTVTVDHGIRPESADEAATVCSLMSKLGATKAVVATSNGDGIGNVGPEGAARDLRYGLLYEEAQKFAAEYELTEVELLVGHTLDDQAETVLMRLGRGAGAQSLAAMRVRQPLQTSRFEHIDQAAESSDQSQGLVKIWLGRPLMNVRRQDTESFCEYLDLPIVYDPSNRTDGPWRTSDGQALRRAAVREWALPQLQRALGQDPAPALARTAVQLQEDNDALELWAAQTLENIANTSANGELTEVESVNEYDLPPLAEQPTAIRKRVLKRIAIENGALPGSISAVHLGLLDALVAEWHGQGPVQLPGGVKIFRQGKKLKATRVGED